MSSVALFSMRTVPWRMVMQGTSGTEPSNAGSRSCMCCRCLEVCLAQQQ